MRQKHNVQLANFDMASLSIISFRWPAVARRSVNGLLKSDPVDGPYPDNEMH